MEWHEIHDPNDAELDRLAALYRLHPLHIEDCRHRNQAAKVEVDGGYLFVVLKPLRMSEGGELESCDLDIFVGADFVITVEEAGQFGVKEMLESLRASRHPMRPDVALYRIMDGIVDSYLPKLDRYNEIIDGLEDKVLENPSPSCLAELFETKRALIQMRRVLANMRDVAGHLQRTESDLVHRDMAPFFRDVYDHLARSLDMVEMERDLLNGALDIYLSSVANRTNRVMKVLTVIGTVALPALVVSSFYGMNVQQLPWTGSPGLITAIMAGCTILLLVMLRAMRWL